MANCLLKVTVGARYVDQLDELAEHACLPRRYIMQQAIQTLYDQRKHEFIRSANEPVEPEPQAKVAPAVKAKPLTGRALDRAIQEEIAKHRPPSVIPRLYKPKLDPSMEDELFFAETERARVAQEEHNAALDRLEASLRPSGNEALLYPMREGLKYEQRRAAALEDDPHSSDTARYDAYRRVCQLIVDIRDAEARGVPERSFDMPVAQEAGELKPYIRTPEDEENDRRMNELIAQWTTEKDESADAAGGLMGEWSGEDD